MSENSNIERNNTGQSVRYKSSELEKWWPCRPKDIPIFNHLYVKMFFEDVAQGVFPYSYDKELVKIVPSDPTLKDSVARALNSNDLQSGLQNFIRLKLLYSLLVYGRACYEIVHDKDGIFKFQTIDPYTLISIFRKYYQYRPHKISRENKIPRLQRIASENIFFIQLSNPIRRKIKKILKVLIYLSHHNVIPKFMHDDLMSAKKLPTHDIDLAWYKKKANEILAKTEKEIGWNARGILKEEMLEYYQLVRFLRFEKFKHQLRSVIINGINMGLSKAFRNSRAPMPMLVIDGLPSEDMIDAAMMSLENGDKKFMEVISPFLNY